MNGDTGVKGYDIEGWEVRVNRGIPGRSTVTYLPAKRSFEHLGVWSHRIEGQSFIDQRSIMNELLQPPKRVLQSLLGCCLAALHWRVS